MAVSLGLGILFGTGVLMLIVPALAMLQRDALVFVQERLMGREQATRQYGPYGTNLATEP
jgi:hypothetical protein